MVSVAHISLKGMRLWGLNDSLKNPQFPTDFRRKIKKLKEKKEKNSLVIKKALFCSFCFYFSSNNVKAYAPKSK